MAKRGETEVMPHQRVLRKCRPRLVECLQIDRLLDFIIAKDFIDDVQIRDIKEQVTTSDKIRMLIDCLQKMDEPSYKKFKDCLEKSGQLSSIKILEEEERKQNEEKYIFTVTRKREQVKHHPALPNLIRMILIGPSGSGKTQLLLNLIMRWLKWNKLYLVAPSVDDQRCYEVLKEFNENALLLSSDDIIDFITNIDEAPSVDDLDGFVNNLVVYDERVLDLVEVEVIAKGSKVQLRFGNPQPYKPGETTSSAAAPEKPEITTNAAKASHQPLPRPTPSVYSKPNVPAAAAATTGSGGSSYSIKSSTPTTPTGGHVHSIANLTPYQNRWRIRARVTQKSNIRTWSNSRGEGKLFSVNLVDESGEIRATGFTDAVDKFFNLLEVNKVFYISRAMLKTANKQYSNVKNDYEMTFNNDTCIEPCEDDVDLPSMTFNFVKINELEKIQPNGLVDVIGMLKQCGGVSTVIGKQSQREITRREIQLVDQSGMVVALTLWGKDAESFDGSGKPVLAIKGARVSDWGGRSLSVLASSQLIINPDIREAHLLRGWYDREGSNMDFTGFKSEMGSGASGGGTNWKFFRQVKSENLGQGDKADYFTSKGTVIFLQKENCMYQACPTETCNKKVIDQGNGMFRCEKCNREFPDFKWRMILSVNLADFSDNQWVTCFQESAEMILGKTAAELGHLLESNEAAFDQVFQDALFKSFIIKLRAKVETYNDEICLKTVCTTANPIDWQEHGRRLVDDIKKMMVS